MEKRRTVLLCFGLVLITLILYWPASGYSFIDYDDGEYVYENPWVSKGLGLATLKWAFTTTWACNWHPLTWISHTLDYSLYGLFAGGHHLTSIVLHALNTLLLFLVLRLMTKAVWPSLIVAAIFAWHPLHVESVAWVAERKDVLSTCFLLLTLWAYTLYSERPTFPKYFMALALFALGLMSKPMLVTLPFVLLLLDYWPLCRTSPHADPSDPDQIYRLWLRLVREKLPFLALSLAVSIMTVVAQGSGGAIKTAEQVSWPLRASVALTAYTGYLAKLVWPANLSVFYPLPAEPPIVTAAFSGLFLAGAIAACWHLRRKYPWLIVGWLWFLGTLVPVIGLVQVGTQAMADRYTYIPMIGLMVMAAWSLDRWYNSILRARVVALAAAGVCLVCCLVLTRVQLSYWRDSIHLFTHALAVTRGNGVAHHSLGLALAEAGRHSEAIEHYQEALRLIPKSVHAHYNLAIEMASAGNLDRAAFHLSEALKLNPQSDKLHNNFGVVLAQQGQAKRATEEFKESIRLNPDYPKPYLNYGMAMQKEGLIRAAATNYARALQLDSDWPEALDKLALLLATCPEADVRNPVVAVNLALRANELTRGESPAYLDTLAVAYAMAGSYSNAASTAELALRAARAKDLKEMEHKLARDLQAYRANRNPTTDLTNLATFGVHR